MFFLRLRGRDGGCEATGRQTGHGGADIQCLLFPSVQVWWEEGRTGGCRFYRVLKAYRRLDFIPCKLQVVVKGF